MLFIEDDTDGRVGAEVFFAIQALVAIFTHAVCQEMPSSAEQICASPHAMLNCFLPQMLRIISIRLESLDMTSNHHKRFAEKHPQGTVVDATLRQAVRDHLVEQEISCVAAHRIATQLKLPAADIGMAIDLQEARIRKCQLGLFGHGSIHKSVQPADTVTPQLKAAIESVLVNGRLPCAQAWRIADAAGMPRMAVASACEMLKIKISQCQLGAF
jgi:hypothetical protein